MTDQSRTVAEVAARLTDAQRRALLWLPADGTWRDHRNLPNSNDGVSRTSLYSLSEKIIGDPKKQVSLIFRLTERGREDGAKEKGAFWSNTQWRLTPLGLAVRAHLEQSS